jgi:transposase
MRAQYIPAQADVPLEYDPGDAIQSCSAPTDKIKVGLEATGHYSRDKAVELRDAARNSIGASMPAKSLELKHTIQLIQTLSAEIEEIEAEIEAFIKQIQSPITSIPGLGYRMGAIILAEVGDFKNFDSADKILAYAGLSPSTYQSGQLNNCHAHMEKRGSKYLRYAIFNATKYVCLWDPTFAAYLAKKRAEGKHYNVAITHAAKKLVRLIYATEKSRQPYQQS